MDIWAYNTETSEMVQVILHPNPDPTISPEEIVRDHLVTNYVHVIYFFAELTMTEV